MKNIVKVGLVLAVLFNCLGLLGMNYGNGINGNLTVNGQVVLNQPSFRVTQYTISNGIANVFLDSNYNSLSTMSHNRLGLIIQMEGSDAGKHEWVFMGIFSNFNGSIINIQLLIFNLFKIRMTILKKYN